MYICAYRMNVGIEVDIFLRNQFYFLLCQNSISNKN